MHCRIRYNCSNLSYDLYHNHLIRRPLCNCNLEIESAEHYFFPRPKYVNERVKLFHETRDFHPLNIYLILFGDINISLETNTTIFRSVRNYIKNTRRFSNSRDNCLAINRDPPEKTHIEYLFTYLVI